MLQLSTVHAYLTYPFVLSWSLLEAMSTGCAILASDTAPVREAIEHNQTGRLVDFFDVAGLADNVIALCEDQAERARLGQAAHTLAASRASHTLPRQGNCKPRRSTKRPIGTDSRRLDAEKHATIRPMSVAP